jgi:hypothetical protein
MAAATSVAAAIFVFIFIRFSQKISLLFFLVYKQKTKAG